MNKLGVRIQVEDLGNLGSVRVFDATTGEELSGIGDISIFIPVGGPARANFTVLVDSLSVNAEAILTEITIGPEGTMMVGQGREADLLSEPAL
jgi:hypothetical protein